MAEQGRGTRTEGRGRRCATWQGNGCTNTCEPGFHWCPECEPKRLAHISARFDEMARRMGGK